jgi:peptide/nickel transport system substrate-binding protein
MKRIRLTAVLAASVALGSGLAACGGGESGTTKSGGGAGYGAAINNVINQSDKKGGTLRFADSDDFDSPDPGNTYAALTQDFARLYGRSLTTFKPAAGKASLALTPDLATSLGQQSDGAKTWKYTLRKGVKFDDGTPVTSRDVKYAVERSNFSDELQGGPKYFQALLVDNKPSYKGPYKDKSDAGLKSIETPDDSTIIFHLNQPFADFDYLVSFTQTMPIPKAKDAGLEFEKHIVSSGPYKVDNYTRGKAMSLSRNPNWDPSTDPVRKALPDRITVQFKQNPDDIDSRLLNGQLDQDIAGVGVQTAAQPKILSDPAKKADADNPIQGFTRYMAIDQKVAPFTNIHCRMAVEFATDKVAAQTGFGGPVAGGDIATTLLPPTVDGHKNFNLYPTKDPHGDLARAKQELAACGKPNGFSTKILARSDRPKEVAAAEGIQQGLAKVGIKADIDQKPNGDYATKYAGAPQYVRSHGAGLIMIAWAADWPTGFGFLSQIVDSHAIKPTGNYNMSEETNPKVDAALDAGIANPNAAARTTAWGNIDEMVMKDAAVVPLIYAKALIYRPPNVTNVGVSLGYGGLYDYLNMGLK